MGSTPIRSTKVFLFLKNKMVEVMLNQTFPSWQLSKSCIWKLGQTVKMSACHAVRSGFNSRSFRNSVMSYSQIKTCTFRGFSIIVVNLYLTIWSSGRRQQSAKLFEKSHVSSNLTMVT